jgi:hypothetical protein
LKQGAAFLTVEIPFVYTQPLVFHPRFARKKRVLPLAEVLASFLMNVARNANHDLAMSLMVFD